MSRIGQDQECSCLFLIFTIHYCLKCFMRQKKTEMLCYRKECCED